MEPLEKKINLDAQGTMEHQKSSYQNRRLKDIRPQFVALL